MEESWKNRPRNCCVPKHDYKLDTIPNSTIEWLTCGETRIIHRCEKCMKFTYNELLLECSESICKKCREERVRNDRNECAICFEEITEQHALIPCGHSDLCALCAIRIIDTPCPFCRRTITGEMKIFKH